MHLETLTTRIQPGTRAVSYRLCNAVVHKAYGQVSTEGLVAFQDVSCHIGCSLESVGGRHYPKMRISCSGDTGYHITTSRISREKTIELPGVVVNTYIYAGYEGSLTGGGSPSSVRDLIVFCFMDQPPLVIESAETGPRSGSRAPVLRVYRPDRPGFEQHCAKELKRPTWSHLIR
jgi:hypothetical protein